MSLIIVNSSPAVNTLIGIVTSIPGVVSNITLPTSLAPKEKLLAEEVTVLRKVLFVKVSVVALPTNVSVEVGKVNVPVLLIEEIIGVVNVLLVSVAAAARSVALEVLSTFPKPTSPLTNPVGEL